MADRKGIFLYFEDSRQFNLLTDDQLGSLVRGLLAYAETGASPEIEDEAVRMAYAFLSARDDRDADRYAEICRKRQNAGSKGGRPPKPNGFGENQLVIDESKKSYHQHQHQHKSQQEGEKAEKPLAHFRGEYGYVKLTDEELQRLIDDLGQVEVDRVITYVDESAAATGNKNKWKDWNLVLRKAAREGWGKKQSQEALKNGTKQTFNGL